MPRVTRLTSPEDFRRTYAEGSRAGTRAVIAHVRDSSTEQPGRLGVTTAKGFGGAVERNRARRRLREAAHAVEEPLRPGVDAVLVATPAAKSLTFQEMVDSVREVLMRAGALSE
jgi:ribonuclease P protein component